LVKSESIISKWQKYKYSGKGYASGGKGKGQKAAGKECQAVVVLVENWVCWCLLMVPELQDLKHTLYLNSNLQKFKYASLINTVTGNLEPETLNLKPAT
jgi:hypothetical protein